MVERATRDSKSLEETKGLPDSLANPKNSLLSKDDDGENDFYKFIEMSSSQAHADTHQQRFIQDQEQQLQIYKSLTRKNEDMNTRIVTYVNATRWLENMGICKSIGSDKDGVNFFLIFGYKFPMNDESARQRGLESLEVVGNFSSSRGKWSVIYFHSRVSYFNNGPLKLLKQIFGRLSEEQVENSVDIVAIHTGWLAKYRSGLIKKCSRPTIIVEKMTFYNTLIEYLEDPSTDQQIAQRIVSELPKDINNIYLAEKRSLADKRAKEKVSSASQAIAETDSLTTNNKQSGKMSYFDRMVEQENSKRAVNYCFDPKLQTTDIMGKHLQEFKRPFGSEDDGVPEIFVLLVNFFEEYPKCLTPINIFRVSGNAQMVEELSVHVSMGNYYFLTNLSDHPHVVTSFLKNVLNRMIDPLCTFALYDRFRDLQKVPAGDRLEKIKVICEDMPSINRNTFVFLIKFLNKVIEHESENRMNAYNIATIFTPITFKPKEFSPQDLIYAGTLVEIFMCMINDYQYIFECYEVENQSHISNRMHNRSGMLLNVNEHENDKFLERSQRDHKSKVDVLAPEGGSSTQNQAKNRLNMHVSQLAHSPNTNDLEFFANLQ